MRVVAINTIRRRINGESQSVKAGSVLELTGKELVELIDAGAVVKPEDPRAAKFGYGPKKGFKAEADDVGAASFESIIDTKGSGSEAPEVASPAADSGAKEDVTAEVKGEAVVNPEAENVDDMTVEEVEAYLEQNKIDKSKGWSKLHADEKRKFLVDYLDAKEAGV